MSTIENYFKRTPRISNSSHPIPINPDRRATKYKIVEVELDPENPPLDPFDRDLIWKYKAQDIDRVRRTHLLRGPFQPVNHDFPFSIEGTGSVRRRFVKDWFDDYKDWLRNDTAHCLYCYLFSNSSQTKQGGGDTFSGKTGFKTWRKKSSFDTHVGEQDSFHNNAMRKCIDLINQKLTASVSNLFSGKASKDNVEYRICLNAAVDCVRLLLRQGFAFRGHNESKSSRNRGNYLEVFYFLADHNVSINNVSFENAPHITQLVAPDIQKDLCIAAAFETTREILKDLNKLPFTILVDESRDISVKEQMAVVLRYVDKEGKIIERFFGIEHVPNTCAISLKLLIDNLFEHHNFNMDMLRGQGYDGASNMQDKNNGLKSLILKEYPQTYYVHCFAHQLQLSLVAVAKCHPEVMYVFEITSKVMNVVGASCKRNDILKANQHDRLLDALEKGEIATGRGLNQEMNLQ